MGKNKSKRKVILYINMNNVSSKPLSYRAMSLFGLHWKYSKRYLQMLTPTGYPLSKKAQKNKEWVVDRAKQSKFFKLFTPMQQQIDYSHVQKFSGFREAVILGRSQVRNIIVFKNYKPKTKGFSTCKPELHMPQINLGKKFQIQEEKQQRKSKKKTFADYRTSNPKQVREEKSKRQKQNSEIGLPSDVGQKIRRADQKLAPVKKRKSKAVVIKTCGAEVHRQCTKKDPPLRGKKISKKVKREVNSDSPYYMAKNMKGLKLQIYHNMKKRINRVTSCFENKKASLEKTRNVFYNCLKEFKLIYNQMKHINRIARKGHYLNIEETDQTPIKYKLEELDQLIHKHSFYKYISDVYYSVPKRRRDYSRGNVPCGEKGYTKRMFLNLQKEAIEKIAILKKENHHLKKLDSFLLEKVVLFRNKCRDLLEKNAILLITEYMRQPRLDQQETGATAVTGEIQ